MEKNKELLASLEATRKQIDAQIEQLKKQSTEPKFEVGKWYKLNNGLIFIESYDNGIKSGYGFWNDTFDSTLCLWDSIDIDDNRVYRPATETEVFEALKKEAIKRGFKEGVRVKIPNRYPFVKSQTICESIIKGDFCYNVDSDGEQKLMNNGACIFSSGKWAEIIKDEPIKIGGYEVKKHPDEDVYTTIDGNVFSKEFWKAAKKISEHSKAKIMIGCSKQFNVDLETINKILEL